MKAIIIAAGLGSRLRPFTDKVPKCLVRIGNKTILESQIEIFKSLGIKDINLIVGYKKNKFKDKKINYIYNNEFLKNNSLESLFYASSKMNSPCIITYSDIIFKKKIVKKLLKSREDISVLVDTDWKKNYKGRTLHPISQAENVVYDKNLFLKKVGKNISSKESNGEFIGMLKINSNGSKIFKKYYKLAKKKFKKNFFYTSKLFKRAYLTDLFCFLIDYKIKIKCVNIKNNWMEIDTIQDYKRAQNFFIKK